MPFDGICVAAVVDELNRNLTGGRIVKIAQPEKEEILLQIKTERDTARLFINVSAGMPFLYLTNENKPSPMTAPNFCMVLRKHLQGGRILSVTQPGLERVVEITVEHLDEMGDLCKRTLVFELMGKHSNLILTDDKNIILDSIKHVSALVSSVREVLPGREWFIPNTEDKFDPLVSKTELWDSFETAMKKPAGVYKRLYTSYTGLSPFAAMELCNAAGCDGDREITEEEKEKLFEEFFGLMQKVRTCDFTPQILYENGRIKEFSVTESESFTEKRTFDSVSEMLATYYSDKNKADVMRSKTADLRHQIQTLLERDYKKADLQKKQLADAENREKFRICGELLNAYAYQIEDGLKKAEVFDYYENKTRTITLDENKTVAENAVRYFDKYNKLKRTAGALAEQMKENEEEIEYLEGILTYISLASTEEDLSQIRRELWERGFVKRLGNVGTNQKAAKNGGAGKGGISGKAGKGGKMPKAKPLHYLTKDGYDIYVGRNNLQNETVTFEIATGNDWWFHAKGVPGAHVVVKCSFANQAQEWDMPDEIFELAGALALMYSKNKDMEKGEIDYLRKKNIRRPNNAATGFVVYYTNYSLVAKNSIEGYELKEV